MSLEPIQRPYSTAEERPATDRPQSDEPAAGSAWWAELSLGAVCFLAAGAVALAQTSVGPFASVAFVYGAVPAALYLAVTAALSLSFLRSGLRRAPGNGESA